MTADETPTPVRLVDVLAAVNRLDDKMTARMDRTDGKVDGLQTRMDRIEGAVSMVKWLGPTGLAAVIGGLLALAGFFPK